MGIESGNLTVIDPDAYYDDKLRARRNSDNMLSSWKPTERLVLVGQVWGVPCPSAHPDKQQIGSFAINTKD